MVEIKRLNCDGTIEPAAYYDGNDPEKSLISFMCYERGMFNSWMFPAHMDEITESKTKPGVWYFCGRTAVGPAYMAYVDGTFAKEA